MAGAIMDGLDSRRLAIASWTMGQSEGPGQVFNIFMRARPVMWKLHKFDVDRHGNPTLVGGSVGMANGPGTATSASPSLILHIKTLCCLDGFVVSIVCISGSIR